MSRLATRRGALIGAGALAAFGARAEPPAVAEAVSEVAGGVFVRAGQLGEAERANANAIANASFVIGRDGVLVFDPGGSLVDGRRLRNAIRRRTDRPIRWLVLSHDHPDHLFGAGAFAVDAPQIIGHAALPAALDARGEFYRARLSRGLGADAVGPVVRPTRLVGGVEDLDIGDRTLRLTAHPPAHTRADLTMFDPSAGLLFAGDLLFVDRVPALDNGSLLGWLAALEALRATGASRVVPGHGPAVVVFAAAADLERYLRRLRDETRAAIHAGRTLDQAVATVGQAERTRWRLFDDYNGRNVTRAYQELEWE